MQGHQGDDTAAVGVLVGDLVGVRDERDLFQELRQRAGTRTGRGGVGISVGTALALGTGIGVGVGVGRRGLQAAARACSNSSATAASSWRFSIRVSSCGSVEAWSSAR